MSPFRRARREPAYLEDARRILAAAPDPAAAPPARVEFGPDFEHLRWFPLPHEIAER